MDTKLIKGPSVWNGDKKKWKHWSSKLEGYIAGVSVDLLTLMGKASAIPTKIELVEMPAEAQEMAGSLFSILSGLTELAAYDILLNTEKGNGFELRRKYCRDNAPKSIGFSRNRMMLILEPNDLVQAGNGYSQLLNQ